MLLVRMHSNAFTRKLLILNTGMLRFSSCVNHSEQVRKYSVRSLAYLGCRNLYTMHGMDRKIFKTICAMTLTNKRLYHNVLLQNTRTKPFLSLPNCVGVNQLEKRHFSLQFLNSLAITQASWFQALSQSKFVGGMMTTLQLIHDSLHIPWWGSIIISTILFRGVLTFPLAVYQNYVLAKLENLSLKMIDLVEELKMETAFAIKKFGWTESYARFMYNKSAKKLWQNLIIEENCHPFKASLLVWVQIPFWISMSMAVRNMATMMPYQDTAAQILFLQFSTGGFLWIPNLTVVDHSLILPFLMGITNLVNLEINTMRKKTPSRAQTIITNVFRLVIIGMVPIAANVPSGVVLYWATSSVCALVQNLVLMHPGFKQVCGIPKSPSFNQNPYQHLWTQFGNKFSRKK